MWAAVVGLGRPEVFPDGAATGTSAASRMARHTGWEGQRIPTVSSPAVTTSGTMGFRRKIMVRVPARGLRQGIGAVRDVRTIPLQVLCRGDVEDQGVVLGAALGREDALHRLRVQAVGPQAVHRLGGDAHQPAPPEDGGGPVHVPGGQCLGIHPAPSSKMIRSSSAGVPTR